MGTTDEIRLPFDYVLGNGKCRMLLKPQHVEEVKKNLERAKSAGSAEGVDFWQGRLDEEEALRKVAVCRVAVFRIPTFMEAGEISASANRFKPEVNDFVRFPELEFPERVSRLLIRVEDENGKTLGGIEQIPNQIIPFLGKELEPWFSLGGTLTDFLSESVEQSVPAKATAGTTRRSNSGT
jgi:hypothetical protein